MRPTADRVREALFNILDGGRFNACYHERLVVDAFAGTGALGLEALSRGADHAVFIELDAAIRRVLIRNIHALDFADATTVIAADASDPSIATTVPAGLVMIDPPYRSGLAGGCLAGLYGHGWIGEDTLVVVELASSEQIDLPAWLDRIDNRRYGATRLVFAAPR